MEERKYFRTIDNPENGDMMRIDEWDVALLCGMITNWDGSGYWVKDNLISDDEAFSTPQLDATHVVWYNK